MESNDNRTFAKLLIGVHEVYGRQAPSAEALEVWWRMLRPYPLEAVSRALGAHTRTEPKFPPTPAQILAFLGNGTGDGRPGADEAWATALTSRDEAVTVVWTEETARAFAACRPVLDSGDEIGARMAFRQTYDRLVSQARTAGEPVRWTASLGWDEAQREAVLLRAETAGLLPAPYVAALLPPPAAEDAPDVNAREQIAKIRGLLASAVSPAERQRRAVEEERARMDQLKAQTAEKVRAYEEVRG
jgi:hypothetical protein